MVEEQDAEDGRRTEAVEDVPTDPDVLRVVEGRVERGHDGQDGQERPPSAPMTRAATGSARARTGAAGRDRARRPADPRPGRSLPGGPARPEAEDLALRRRAAARAVDRVEDERRARRRPRSQSIARWARDDDDHVAPAEERLEGHRVAGRPVRVAEARRRAGRGSGRPRRAPARPARTSAAGELRASRTSGLKATPRTPTRAPFSARPRSLRRLGDEVDDVARHREVDVAGELDEAVDEVELAGPPGQVVRVDRDAVAADARARG